MEVVKNQTESKRKRLDILRSQLEQERATFIPHWREIADHVFPRRARFSLTDVNKGDRRNSKIIDSSPMLAARTLRAGMMGGITSPARPWFRLATPDPKMMESAKVKDWLDIVKTRMSAAFLRSNLYNVLPIVYGDLGTFGTAPMSIEEDFENAVHFGSFPIGSYMVAKDQKGRVNVFFREFRMTVRQVLATFGDRDPKTGKYDFSNFSNYIKSQYETGQLESWVDICHCIQPNENHNPKKLESKFKKYESVYYERGSMGSGGFYITGADEDKYLRIAGYDYFPILCPRWEVTGEDVYGTDCPGMSALGDIKQLMLQEKRIAQAVEKMVNPPMTGPSTLKNQKASILPGDITYIDVRDGNNQGFRPAHEVNLRIGELEQKQQQLRQRIDRVFYADLFLMLANDERAQITATEINERKEEKLLALGPVLEQLNQDLLDPLIDATFDIMSRQNAFPEPPEELHGVQLKVEYVSVMAQAQKLISIGAHDRFMQYVGQIAGMNPGVLDKVDFDQSVDIYGEITSVTPGLIRSDEDVQAMRDEKVRSQQQQAQVEQMNQMANTAKQLSETKTSGDNALSGLMDMANAGNPLPA